MSTLNVISSRKQFAGEVLEDFHANYYVSVNGGILINALLLAYCSELLTWAQVQECLANAMLFTDLCPPSSADNVTYVPGKAFNPKGLKANLGRAQSSGRIFRSGKKVVS